MANKGKWRSKRKRPGSKNHSVNRERSQVARKKHRVMVFKKQVMMAQKRFVGEVMRLFFSGEAVDFRTAREMARERKAHQAKP